MIEPLRNSVLRAPCKATPPPSPCSSAVGSYRSPARHRRMMTANPDRLHDVSRAQAPPRTTWPVPASAAQSWMTTSSSVT
eukprot:5415944-Prymnesium_polylepis.2